MPQGRIAGEQVITEHKAYYDKSRYGVLVEDKVRLSFYEALFLMEKKKLTVIDGHNKDVSPEKLLRRGKRLDSHFPLKYKVFADLRAKGYITKTALKFGADFRVYEKGVKPGDDHAKWVVFAVHESHALRWQDFAAKNRVAHSTRKKLLIGVVDNEDDVTYFEVAWERP